MGQHLQLYASKNVSVQQAKTFCYWKVFDIISSPSEEEQSTILAVESVMRGPASDHLDHWASGGGVSAFPFLCDAHECTDALIEEAVKAGRAYSEMQNNKNPGSTYAKHDWANDDAIQFLREHIGYVVWGYNDGI